MFVRSLIVVASIAEFALPAQSQDCDAPCVGYTFSGEIQDNWAIAATPKSLKQNDLGPTVDFGINVVLVEGFEFIAATTTEAVLDLEPGKDRAFEDLGTYLDEFYVKAAFDPITFRAGKFAPVFGLATDEMPGIASTDLVGDYDNSERWAAEAAFDFDALGLSHTATLALFTADRTVFSDSIFTSRGRSRYADGGAGNSRGVSSLAATISGCFAAEPADCYEDGRYGYRLAVRYQDAGFATADQIDAGVTPKDELGLLAAGTAKFELADETALRGLIETAYFDHFEGGPGDALVFAGSLALERGSWTYSAGYTHRADIFVRELNTSDDLFDLSVVYDFGEAYSLAGESWKLGAGYSYSKNGDGESAHVLSATLKFEIDGSILGH